MGRHPRTSTAKQTNQNRRGTKRELSRNAKRRAVSGARLYMAGCVSHADCGFADTATPLPCFPTGPTFGTKERATTVCGGSGKSARLPIHTPTDGVYTYLVRCLGEPGPIKLPRLSPARSYTTSTRAVRGSWCLCNFAWLHSSSSAFARGVVIFLRFLTFSRTLREGGGFSTYFLTFSEFSGRFFFRPARCV